MDKDKQIALLEAEIDELKQTIAMLTAQLKLAQHRRFGSSSERLKGNEGQPTLFEAMGLEVKKESSNTEPPAEPEREKIKEYTRRKAGQVGIGRLPKDLPIEVVEHVVPDEERICPVCGEPMHVMCHDTREELVIVPAQAMIRQHRSEVLSCRHCEKHGTEVPIVKAEMPKPVISGSFAAPETIAHIICEKFVMGVPLYRQEQDWGRKSIPISRQTMNEWEMRATNKWLSPIYKKMREELLESSVLHADETTVQVLNDGPKNARQKRYMWVFRTGCGAREPIISFEYKDDRRAENPRTFLKDYKGYLHTDGYEGYHSLPPDIIVVGCWAHLRRRFDEALKAIPKASQSSSPPMEALRRIGELYKLEEEFRELPSDENYKARLEGRQQRSKPLVDAFFEWCGEQNALPKTHFGKALSYALNQRKWLENYLLDGRLEIDNNRAERSIKPFVIGRKNWLFCNTRGGAEASAMLYSIIETAKENGLDPFEYLTFVFENAPNMNVSDDNVPDILMPFKRIDKTDMN